MKRIKNYIGGQIGVPLAFVLTGATFLISGFTSYFTSEMSTQAKVADLTQGMTMEISADRQRIATLEEAILTIKTSQKTTESDVKEILKLLK